VTETGPLLDEAYVATGQVQYFYRHFPLDFHQNAMPASVASYCAGQQDPKLFWEMNHWLFENQQTWSEAADAAAQFRTQAVGLGVNEADFDKCVADPASQARIQQDLQEGAAKGVSGTPAFFINDWFISGAVPFEQFQQTIDKAKAGQKPPPTPTPLPAGAEFWQPDPNRAGQNFDGSFFLGEADAPVVILAFEDFKNPNSTQHFTAIEPQLRSEFIDPGTVRYVVQMFPLTSPRAGAALLCAGKQDKFWEMRELLYTKQNEWEEGDDAAMQAFAKTLGLDEAQFGACLADEATSNEISRLVEFAQQGIGVPSAPAYLVIKVGAQGQGEQAQGLPPGAVTIEQFREAITAIQAPPTPTPTPAPSISQAELAQLQVGRDADGNFYRGDPNAPVKLVDFSDFQ
jgi:protein-disulfide isomerase